MNVYKQSGILAAAAALTFWVCAGTCHRAEAGNATAEKHHRNGGGEKPDRGRGDGDDLTTITPVGNDPVWGQVQQALNAEGEIRPGNVLEVNVPRENIVVRRGQIPVRAYLQVYFDFEFLHTGANTAMVDGDGPMLDSEINPFVAALEQGGFKISAIHRHILDLEPHLIYIHYSAEGNPVTLARTMRQIVERITRARFHSDKNQGTTLNKTSLDQILGASGTVEPENVVSYDFDRAEQITEAGTPVPSSFGAYTEFRFEALSRTQAAVAVECCVTAEEIDDVLKALAQNGLEIQVLHNHMTDEQPRLFFIHAWGVGNAESLARALRDAVVNRTNVKPE